MYAKQKITALIICSCFIATVVAAQSNITRVEYFFNTDPGFGKGNLISITPNSNIHDFPASLPVTALAPGLNTLFIRSANAKNLWSITNSFLFLKTSLPPAANITAAEYFIDADPGFGLATAIPVTTGSTVADVSLAVDISAKNSGLHTLFIRSKNANDKWSITNNFLFLKAPLPPQANITGAEYFIDKDPGFGNAIAIPVTSKTNVAAMPVSVNVASALQGLHTLFLRSKDANGKWSITNNFLFYKTSNVQYNIVEAEYFIDKDPGFGAGVKIPQISPSLVDSNVSFNIDITAMDSGNHDLFIRSKDATGKWSITNYIQFMKKPGILPVTWLSFEAIPLENKVLLQWKTATEENTSYFEIQFSADGIAFSGIGKVAAAGNSVLVSTYKFTHTSPVLNGINYYRIKQFDKDSRYTYSPMRTAKFTTADFTVNPNPVRNNLTVYTKQEGLTVHVFDASGKSLFTQRISNFSATFNFSMLANGMYYLVAEKGGKPLYTKKILKQ